MDMILLDWTRMGKSYCLAGVVAERGRYRVVRPLPSIIGWRFARQLGLPPERVWSETPQTGNLGSVTLPVAWATHQPGPTGPVAWAAVGAGLTWGTVITGAPLVGTRSVNDG
ncbi:MAG TPA: 3-oxoacyl-[acyl-carrier-protein] synthase III C-terminal domain-containing protein [Gemmataceae bacterium]|nr:3-oxoacyl-[acyl-carrier-protein] synthase III C-terminal domain-containing protein [Gemmataceae bacterium]